MSTLKRVVEQIPIPSNGEGPTWIGQRYAIKPPARAARAPITIKSTRALAALGAADAKRQRRQARNRKLA